MSCLADTGSIQYGVFIDKITQDDSFVYLQSANGTSYKVWRVLTVLPCLRWHLH